VAVSLADVVCDRASRACVPVDVSSLVSLCTDD
jgi:hypothetical protein